MWKIMRLLWVLFRYRSKKAFFRYIQRNVCARKSLEYRRIQEAYSDMQDAFQETFRESGAPYMTHLHAVAVIVTVYLRCRDTNTIISALLHDAAEHFSDRFNFLSLSRQYNEANAMTTIALSKPSLSYFGSEAERDDIYHLSFGQAPTRTLLIKLADRLHNTLTLCFCDRKKRERKAQENINFYLVHAQKNAILSDELRIATKLLPIVTFFVRLIERA